MGAIIWAAAGLLLIAAETLSGDFVLLMLGGGALAAAGASAFGADIWLAAIVFAVASILMLLVVRPALRRHFRSSPMIPSNTDALLGRPATVIEQVTAEGGLVRIGGDVWSARAGEPDTAYEPDDTVVVRHIDGAIAVVTRG